MERMVEYALIDAGIAFATDQHGGNPSRLDFRLIDYDVEIEVKRFHSPRVADQMARAENVIAVQGEAAVRFFCDALRGAYGAKSMLAAEAAPSPDAGQLTVKGDQERSGIESGHDDVQLSG